MNWPLFGREDDLKTIVVALVGLFWSAAQLSAEPTCIGPDSASSAWVYFHGLDDPTIGAHELRNRNLLRMISEDLKVRIALPRGEKRCNEKACWDHQDEASILEAVAKVRQEMSECIGKRPVRGFFGFSNGGYLVNKYFQICPDTAEKMHYLSIGAAGDFEAKVKENGACGHLTLAIGRKDQLVNQVQLLYQNLAERFPEQVELERFLGGHDLNERILRQWFEKSKIPPTPRLKK